MSVWSKLFGEKAAGIAAEHEGPLRPPTPGNPSSLIAVPRKVEVTFHAHDSVEGTAGNFLSAVTSGLAKYKQRELVVTLRLASDDNVLGKMQELSRFFATVYNWAREGHIVDSGELTHFGARGPFGRSNGGLLYVNARPIRGLDLSARALAVVFVDEPEVRLAMSYGAYRVLARIGESQRHFPFPIWSDLSRPSVANARDADSLLAKVAKTRTRGATFVVEGERVRVLLLPSVRKELLRRVASLPTGTPFALLTEPAPNANAVLVWHPGQTEPKAITASGSDSSRLSGCFLMVVPGGQANQTRAFEDGYSLLFSNDSWANVAAALVEGRGLKMRMADDMTLELVWLSDEHATLAG
jgi:hypothetical protein